MQHTCGECHYLTRTSPEQVFLLCRFWSAEYYPVKGAGKVMRKECKNYPELHCHMQPWAPACPFYRRRLNDFEVLYPLGATA